MVENNMLTVEFVLFPFANDRWTKHPIVEPLPFIRTPKRTSRKHMEQIGAGLGFVAVQYIN